MNPKILVAFVTGAVIASGIVYMAVRPEVEAKHPKVVAVSRPDVPPPPAPEASAEAPAAAAPEAAKPAPVHEKPSPMPPPVRREKPVTVAQNQEPPPPPAPAPVREPINKERPYNDARPAEPAPQPPPAAESPAPQPQPAPAPSEDAPKPSPAPEARMPHTVTIPAGTWLPVRIGETLSSRSNQTGDNFLATLDQPLVADGFIIAERGSRVEGRIVLAEPGRRTSGVPQLAIELVKVSTSDGQHVKIRTEAYKREAKSASGEDVAKVASGAAIGAAIGAAAGGGKGAAIGAGVGGAAGVAGVLLTRDRPIEIPVETRISFKLQEPVTITERIE